MTTIPRPLNFGAPPGVQPLIGGVAIPPEVMNPRPMAQQGAGILPPQFQRNMPGPGAAPAAPPADPLAGAPMIGAPAMAAQPTGQQPGMGGRIRNFLGSDAALGLAAGILEGGTSAQALGRGMGYALQTRQAERAMQSKGQATTDDIREYAFAKQQGFEGTFTDWMTRKAVAGAQKSIGAPPTGYRYEMDEFGNPVQAVPIEGSPAWQEAEAAKMAKEGRAESAAQSADIVLGAIDDAEMIFKASPGWTTGMGGAIMLNMPGSGAVDLQEAIAPIEASIAFDRLQKTREESPTGGALGAVSERELALLAATVSSLKQSQSPQAFERNLNKVKTVYRGIAKKFAAYPNAGTYGFAPPETYNEGGGQPQAQDPLGIR